MLREENECNVLKILAALLSRDSCDDGNVDDGNVRKRSVEQ